LLTSCLRGSEAEALDAGQDLIGRLGPAEWLGIVIDGIDIILDGLFAFLRGTMETPAQLFFGQESEKSLDLVQP